MIPGERMLPERWEKKCVDSGGEDASRTLGKKCDDSGGEYVED